MDVRGGGRRGALVQIFEDVQMVGLDSAMGVRYSWIDRKWVGVSVHVFPVQHNQEQQHGDDHSEHQLEFMVPHKVKVRHDLGAQCFPLLQVLTARILTDILVGEGTVELNGFPESIAVNVGNQHHKPNPDDINKTAVNELVSIGVGEEQKHENCNQIQIQQSDAVL